MAQKVEAGLNDLAHNDLPVFHFTSLRSTGIVHGVTTRTRELPYFGNMSYMVGDDPEQVRMSRNAWAGAIGYDPHRLVLGRQIHKTAVAIVGEEHAGRGSDSVESSILGVDGLITNTECLPIGVMAADCVPILIHDPVVGAIGAIHAGWRGTVDGIAIEAVASMERAFGSNPQNLRVGLGPSICVKCYQVGPEVAERWNTSLHAKRSIAVHGDNEDVHFDLRQANLEQLQHAGVPAGSIEVSAACTRCSNGAMFSRRGLGPGTGLFTAVIMLQPERRHGLRRES